MDQIRVFLSHKHDKLNYTEWGDLGEEYYSLVRVGIIFYLIGI